MIKCNIDASAALELVQRQLPAAVPYVKATFLTNAAQGVQGAIKKQLPVSFDRPTPFTVRSVWIKPAGKLTPKAEVYFPDSAANSGKSRREYIRPGAQGASARAQKRSEMLLVKAGVLPSGWVTVPGNYAMRNLLDGFGNMKGQYYRQIIRNLQHTTDVLCCSNAQVSRDAVSYTASSSSRAIPIATIRPRSTQGGTISATAVNANTL